MILDADLLLYAVDESAQHHTRAKAFLEEHLNGEVRIGLPWQSTSAFLRIATHSRIMARPLTAKAAAQIVDDWLTAPATWVPEPTSTTWVVLRRLLVDHAVTGNVVPDAQLAALAIQHGVPVASADSDFARFPEIVWVNPFSDGPGR